MSFSSKTKNELARKNSDNRCCQLAELSALIRVSGTIQLVGLRKTNVMIVTENSAVARLVFTLFKKSLNIHTEINTTKNKVLRKNNSYFIKITNATVVLKKLGIFVDEDNGFYINDGLPDKLLEKECCKRSYLRGAFLGGGSVSDPEKSYHMEFIVHNEVYGNKLIELLALYDLNAKLVSRKNNFIVYLKEGDKIVDLLNVIGAHNALLSFENTRIVKQMRNDVNRLVNCETANLNKIVDTGFRQKLMIELIEKKIGISTIQENLQEVAKLRMLYSDVSLKELGQMLDKPLSKSGVNHKMKKLQKIAEELEEG